MRTAIIAHQGKAGGALSVGRNLITSLIRLQPETCFFITLPPAISPSELPRGQAGNHLLVVRPKHRFEQWTFERIALPRLLRAFRPDVILAVGNRGLLSPPCPQAILVQRPHLFYPSSHYSREPFHRKLLFTYLRWEFARQLKTTQLLLVQTRVVEKRIRQWYGYSGVVAICPNAVSTDTMAASGDSGYPTKLEQYREKKRLFCLSVYNAHKNLEILVEMFDSYREQLRDIIVILTIQPEDHPLARKLLRRIRVLGLESSLVNVGRLAQKELAGYYNNCHGMVFPTLLESFSGTYLEAMYFGVPILTSDMDFAREVCGEAAFYFDPHSAESIKNTVLSVLGNPENSRAMTEAGRKRLTEYCRDWDSIARDVLRELSSIAGKQP